MKKKYLPKPKKKNLIEIYGAYDKDGKFWHKEDIKNATGGIIRICFEMEKENIVFTLKK